MSALGWAGFFVTLAGALAAVGAIASKNWHGPIAVVCVSLIVLGLCFAILGGIHFASPSHGPTAGGPLSSPPATGSRTAGSPALSSSTQASPGTVLFRKNGVQLSQGHALSFTDPSLRPYADPTFPCSADLYVCALNSLVGSGAQLTVIDGQAGFSQCLADTTYVAPGGYADQDGQTLVGKTLCVTTSDRIAACYVTADTTQEGVAAPELTMDITVYALK
jgi:hypothetical protein